MRGFVSHLSLLVAIKFPCLLAETVIEIVGYISTWSKEGAGERGRGGRGRREGEEGEREEGGDNRKNMVEPLVLYIVLRKREREREREEEREEEATDHTDLVSATVYQDSPGQRQAAVLR